MSGEDAGTRGVAEKGLDRGTPTGDERGTAAKQPEAAKTSAVAGRDWRFTWADLERLSGNLTLAPDRATSWVPRRLSTNILKVIRYVLNPQNAYEGVWLSKAVSVLDFHHGHLIIPPGEMIPSSLATNLREFRREHYDARMKSAYPPFDETFPLARAPSASEREAMREVDASIADDLADCLREIEQALPQLGISYHTYEHNSDSFQIPKSWPGRNLFAPYAGAIDSFFHDRPPATNTSAGGRTATNSAGSAAVTLDFHDSAYPRVLTFYFLVSPGGVVFIRYGDVSLLALEDSPPRPAQPESAPQHYYGKGPQP